MSDKGLHMQASSLNKNEHAGLVPHCIIINLITSTMTELFMLQGISLQQLLLYTWSHPQLSVAECHNT